MGGGGTGGGSMRMLVAWIGWIVYRLITFYCVVVILTFAAGDKIEEGRLLGGSGGDIGPRCTSGRGRGVCSYSHTVVDVVCRLGEVLYGSLGSPLPSQLLPNGSEPW